jgi:hypothetical protein
MLEGKGLTLGDLMGACLDANQGPLRYQRSKARLDVDGLAAD